MTNSSFAVVELALTLLLRSAVPAGVEVTTLPPKLAAGFKSKKGLTGRVNVALCRVDVSQASRNLLERPDRSGRIQPKSAFALSYLISAYSATEAAPMGGTTELLECVLRGLIAQPMLSLPATAGASADVQENIRVMIQTLSLEDWTSLWTALQTELRPGVVCLVDPVVVL